MPQVTSASGSNPITSPASTTDNHHEDYEEDNNDPVSKRKRKRTKRAASTESSTLSPSDAQPPRNKKQRVPKQFRKVRGKFGLLERLAKDMPVEVILEVFCYLHPRDLLRLARTSKDLRSILMSKSSANIWQLAGSNVEGLPPCPDDLSEPQYANLLFEPQCHVCMGPGRCENILWNFRIRSCYQCLRTRSRFSTSPLAGLPNDHPLAAHQHSDIFPSELITYHPSRTTLYLIGDKNIVQCYRAEYDALNTQEDRDAWIILKKKQRLAIKEHNKQYTAWHEMSLKSRANELSVVRQDRKTAILSRLKEIGWDDEVQIIMQATTTNCDRFTNHKLVKQSKKLTEHDWRTIKDDLVEFLTTNKRKRLFDPRLSCTLQMYGTVLSYSDLREPYPTMGDVLHTTSVWYTSTPENQNLTSTLFRSRFHEHLRGFITEWRAANDQQLLEIVRKSRPTATVSDLHLATTVFRCESCNQGDGETLYYPQLFYHRCCTSPFVNYPDDTPNQYPGPWSPIRIKYSEAYSAHARKLVEACALDPNTATIQDLYDANPLFECTTCETSSQVWCGGRLFMRWPYPLHHDRNHDFRALSHEEEMDVVASEPPIRCYLVFPICCACCHQEVHMHSIVEHLKAKHYNTVVDFPESGTYEEQVKALRKHWYWRYDTPLSHMGNLFRHKDSATAAVPQSTRDTEVSHNEDYEEDNNHSVTKRKRKRKRRAASVDSSTSSQIETSSIKRQRVPEQFRKVRGKLGLLDKLAKNIMPVELILEIFCYLQPRDLLRLARTSKDLRSVLMSKSSANIWRLAGSNVEGLPPCPVDLSEPQYANLLFEPHCHVCMRSGRCDNILWNFRMRCCQKCLRTFPTSPIAGLPNNHPLAAHQYSDIFPRELVKYNSSHKTEHLIGNKEIVLCYKAEFDALKTQEDRNAWIIRKRTERLAINKHNQEYADWHELSLRSRADRFNAIRDDRKAAILSRLEDIGWRDEAVILMQNFSHGFDDPFSNLKSVRQPRKLTNRDWLTIKDEIVQFLSDIKRRRLFEPRVSCTVQSYDAIISKSDLRELPLPTMGDVLLSTSIWYTNGAPENQDWSTEFFRSKFLSHLHGFISQWRVKTNHQLLEIVQKSRPTASVSDLLLATTVFKCETCFGHDIPLYYPQLFNHHCCVNSSVGFLIRGPPFVRAHHHGPWSSLPIEYSDSFSDHAKKLVEACSLDPNTATIQDLYEANPLFECITCKRDPQEQWVGGRLFMRLSRRSWHRRVTRAQAQARPYTG
ncbi:hypothetical protein F5880DRAFT_1700706 [Lentinula raphanica]|nr:hypothetical protein F5880DRAFT_1700706 [Lentinula raphanica]